jgi:hypothetical protein
MTDPPMNWGYPRTVEGFFHVISRGQYERLYPTDSMARFLEQLRIYFSAAGKEFGWFYLPLAAVPFCFSRRIPASERKWLWATLAAYLCLAFLMLAVLNPASDMQSVELVKTFFSASYILLAFWLGCGLVILGRLLTRPADSTRSAR